MDKQQNAPVLTPFFVGEPKRISDIWQAWFQKLKTRDEENRRPPYKTYTADQQLTTWELGRIVQFATGTSDLVATLPVVEEKDIWSWLTILRTGTGMLTITADDSSRIEYSSSGGSMYCIEEKRKAANVTLQLVSANQWAIMAGFGTWEID
jgi:hypothetical protein